MSYGSHSNDFLAQLCNTALWIDHGQIRSAGLVDEVVEDYEGKGAGDYVRTLLKRFEAEESGSGQS